MTKMEKYTSTEHKNTDKEWWKNEFLIPFGEMLDLFARSNDLAEQALDLLASETSDDLTKIDECIAKQREIDEKSEKILKKLKEKIDKKYPKREYDPREKKGKKD